MCILIHVFLCVGQGITPSTSYFFTNCGLMIKAAAVGTHDRERLLILRYAGEHRRKNNIYKNNRRKKKEAEASFFVYAVFLQFSTIN